MSKLKKIGLFLFYSWIAYLGSMVIALGIQIFLEELLGLFSLIREQSLFSKLLQIAASLIAGYFLNRKSWKTKLILPSEVLAFIILPLCGLALNLLAGNCSGCARGGPLSSPGVFSLYAVYFFSVGAYFISRYKGNVTGTIQVYLNAFLMMGALISFFLTVHFQLSGMPAFFLIASYPSLLVLPLIAPLWVLILFSMEIYRQYRKEKWGHLPVVIFLSLTSIWFLIHKLIFTKWPWTIFTQTCDWGFSLQVQQPTQDCHYLCTVAARGHPGIVKPIRLGKRHGQTIIVNRQLQIANAFEDLLVELFPRFGRLCRKVYDKVGLPISSLISNTWLSDFVYLLMKPLEWTFYLFLVLFDPHNPEKRIDRMYQ